jgi:tetratricopeptide (TPR) repeat protein
MTRADRRPLCFVLMPFGTREDHGIRDDHGGVIEFDAVYARIIKPAVEAAGLQAVRADEERIGGIIHKPMFERLLLCEYAVADLTAANANVYYELGIRHAVRPWSTVLLFRDGFRLPFDLGPLRALPYRVNRAGRPANAPDDRARLTASLLAAREQATDSPLFQLVDGLVPPDLSRLDADVFRDRVQTAAALQERLATARRADVAAVRAVHAELGDLRDVETGLIVDLLLSYRAVDAHAEMIDLVEAMPPAVARTSLVREQLAFALNRVGRHEDAERVLRRLIDERGPSSETYGILGRVHKDRWDDARAAGRPERAAALLDRAVDAYRRGFESDWRDHYPGINAIQLMVLRDPDDPEIAELAPVVRYSARRKVRTGAADYWDHATLLELAVLDGDEPAAREALGGALAEDPEPWQAGSTLRTLDRFVAARASAGVPAWTADVRRRLAEAARQG